LPPNIPPSWSIPPRHLPSQYASRPAECPNPEDDDDDDDDDDDADTPELFSGNSERGLLAVLQCIMAFITDSDRFIRAHRLLLLLLLLLFGH